MMSCYIWRVIGCPKNRLTEKLKYDKHGQATFDTPGILTTTYFRQPVTQLIATLKHLRNTYLMNLYKKIFFN